MNTLLELNGRYENAIVTDERSAGITFDRPTPTNQILNFSEGQQPNLTAGIYIVEIVNYEFVNCRATFNVSGIPGATLDFGTLPNAVTVSLTSPGIYQVDNIRSDYDWLVVSAPKLVIPFDFSGAYSISVTINSSAAPKSYIVSGTVSDVAEWTTTITDFWYETNAVNAVTGSPRLIDVNNPIATWVVTLTPSDPALVTTLSTSGTGGTTSFNSTTKALTINGTNAQINSHLDTLVLTSPISARSHFNIQYRASHLTLGYSDVTFQNIRAQVIRYLGDVRYDVDYDEDNVLATLGVSTPLITDTEYTGGGTYTLTITPSTPAAIDTLASTGTGGTASFNSTTKVLTLTGTKAQINTRLDTILINTASDYDQTFTLTYALTTPLNFFASKVQTLTVQATHSEVANMNIARSYAYNTAGLLFVTDIPAITDQDPDVTTYTITLITTQGQFSAPGTTTGSTWTYTGSRTDINNLFGQITFTPNNGAFQAESVIYRQVKAGVTQVDTAFSLVGPGIKFDKTTPDNQTVNTNEGSTWSQPIGINVIGVEDPITYTIDLSSANGATSVLWPSLPAGVTASTPSANVYRLSNITTLAQWNAVRYPTIRLNNTYNGTFSYTSSIGWRSNTQSWSTAVSVADVALMTQPTNLNYFAGQTQSITGYPQVIDAGTQSLDYTVTLTPSDPGNVSTISAGGTGGTVNFNATTKVFSISGTLSQVNARLAAMSITFTPTAGNSFYITYAAVSSAGEGQSWLQNFTKQADFTFTSLGNQSVTVNEGQEHTVVPGYSITFLNTSYTRLRYVIDISNIPGAQIIWDTVPSGCVVTNPTTGIYQITNISTNEIWTAVRSPRVTLRNDVSGIYTYTATLTDDFQTYSWSTSLTVNQVDLLTAVTASTYYSGTTQAINGYTQIVDQGNQTPTFTTYVATTKPAVISTITTSGTGGTTAFNPSSKMLTIVGTKDQVNSHLSTMSLTSVTGQDLSFNFTYSASNNLNSESQSKIQAMTSNNFTVLNAVRSAGSFTSSTQTAITGGPLVAATDSGTYTLQVYAVPNTAASKVTFTDPDYSWSLENTVSIGTNGGWFKSTGGYLIASNNSTSIRLYSVTSANISLLTTFNFGFTVTEANTTISILDSGVEVMAGNPSNKQVIRRHYQLAQTFTQTFSNAFSNLTRHSRTQLLNTFDPDNNGYRLSSINQSTGLYAEDSTTYFNETATLVSPSKISLTYGGRTSNDTIGSGELMASLTTTGLRLARFSPVQTGFISFANASDFAVSEDGTVIAISSNADKTVKVYYKALGDFGLTYTLATTITGTEADFGKKVAVSYYGDCLAIGGKYFYKRSGNTWIQRNTIDNASTAGEYVEIDYIGEDIITTVLSGTNIKVYKNNEVSWNSTTKIATKTGTKETINAAIDQVLLTPAVGQNSGFELYYKVTTPTSAESTRNQTINKV